MIKWYIGCPWSDWAPPNVKWCEKSRCSWITEPSNTWSNLSYLIIAGMIHYRLVHNKRQKHLVYLFAPAIFLTGSFSFIYHASYTRVLQILDFFGMYLFICLALALNSHRMNTVCDDKPKTMWFYFWTVILSMVSIPVIDTMNLPIQFTMIMLILALLGQEIYLRFSKYTKYPQLAPSLEDFRKSLFILGIALSCSVADGARIWCNPESIIQGHAMWHILSAVGMWFTFKYYEQIDFDRCGEGVPLG
jgi:hypothetical protein